jgi:hypothetical protein
MRPGSTMTDEEFFDLRSLVCFEPDEMFIEDVDAMLAARCAARREMAEMEGEL